MAGGLGLHSVDDAGPLSEERLAVPYSGLSTIGARFGAIPWRHLKKVKDPLDSLLDVTAVVPSNQLAESTFGGRGLRLNNVLSPLRLRLETTLRFHAARLPGGPKKPW